MKISINWSNSVLKRILLYSTLVTVQVAVINLAGVSTQTQNPPCLQMDFDRADLGTDFSACPDGLPTFNIRSYDDVSFGTGNFQYHLTNGGSLFSCTQTNQVYNITRATQISAQLFWQSTKPNDFFEIQILDEETGNTNTSLYAGGIENNWVTLTKGNTYTIPNAKIRIRAVTSNDTQLAIDYIYVLNPECELSTSTSTEALTTELVPYFIEKQCFSSNLEKEKVFIKPQLYQMDVTVNSNEVSVLIGRREPNLGLIWFGTKKLPNNFSDSYHQNPIIDCATASQNEIKIRKERDTAFTVCLINMADTTVSPLDCISFYYYGAEINDVWLLQSTKPLVIKVIVACLLVTIIFGIIIGSIYRFRMAVHSSNYKVSSNPNVFIDSNDGGTVSEKCPRNGEQIHHIGFGSKRIYDSELPPLPPHPQSSIICLDIDNNDENDRKDYATVV